MTSPPLVSVLGLAYNHEKFIAEFIESAQSQTYRQLELVIADDGSTDATPDIVRRYASADVRIKLVRADRNQGLPANYNRAIRECGGEFIAILGADDVMMPDKVEAQVDFFLGHEDCGALSHDSLVVDEKGDVLYQWSERHKPLVGGPECWFGTNWLLRKDRRFAPPSLMLRRSFMLGAPYDPRISICNEWLHPVQCSLKRPDLKWRYLAKVLTKYRKHKRQQSQNPALADRYYEEHMLVLCIVSSRYPQASSLVRSCRAYWQFKFLVYDWHKPEKRKSFEAQFRREAGWTKWFYMKATKYYLHNKALFEATGPLRRFLKKTFGEKVS